MRIRSVKPDFWRKDTVAALPMDLRLLLIGLSSYVDDNGVGIDDHRQIAADLFPLEDDPVAAREFVSRGLATLSRALLLRRYKVNNRALIFVVGWDEAQRIDRPSKARYDRPPEDLDPLTSNNGDPRDTLATPSRDTREPSRVPIEGSLLEKGVGSREKGVGSPPSGDPAPSGRGARVPAIAPASVPAGARPRARATPTRIPDEFQITRAKPTTGTRIPDNFQVTPPMVAWARDNARGVDGRRETERFIDHWRAKTGKDATKRDWIATWRNWMRTAQDRLPANRRSGIDENILAMEAMKDHPFWETAAQPQPAWDHDAPPWELRAIEGGRAG